MAELGDTLREEIDSGLPVSVSALSMPTTMNNSQLRIAAHLPPGQHHQYQQSGELHYRPVTLQQLPAASGTAANVTPVVYKSVQEVRHSFAPGQPHALNFPSHQPPRREFVVIAAQPSSQDIQTGSPQFNRHQQPLVNYPMLRLPQAQPILIRPQNIPGIVRIEEKSLALPQRPVNLVPEERPRLPVTALPMTTSQTLTMTTSNVPTDLSVTKKVAPDFLQQRIDKVISENQAIVETLDPLWPRRYMRQSSKDQSSSDEKGHKTGNRKYSLPSTTVATTAATTTASSASLFTTAPAFITQQQLQQHQLQQHQSQQLQQHQSQQLQQHQSQQHQQQHQSHQQQHQLHQHQQQHQSQQHQQQHQSQQQRPAVRFPETILTFPRHPVAVLSSTTSATTASRTFVTSLSETEPVYVMSSPLDLANRKRTISVTTVIPTSAVTDSSLAGKFSYLFCIELML